MSHPSQTPDPRNQADAGQQHAQQYAPHLPGYSSGEQFSGGYGYGGQPIDPATGYPYPPQGWAPPSPSKSNGLAIASLIVGVVALALAWIPIINYAAMVLGIIGLVLGGIGIFQSHRMMSIAGATLSLVAIVVSFAVFASFANSVDQAVDDYNSATSAIPSDPALTDPDLGYEAEGYPTEDLPETNGRGNIVKAIGEDAGVGGLERGVDTAVWSVDGIETDITCTEPYQSAQPEGHLTAVDFNLSTGPDWDSYTGGYGYVSGGYFTFIDSQGVTHSELDGMPTYSCLSDRDMFNEGAIGAGQNYTGKIVLDLPDTTGTLVFTPSWDVYNTSGWEYPVG